eukprot:209550-Rhodomonas_salina.2
MRTLDPSPHIQVQDCQCTRALPRPGPGRPPLNSCSSSSSGSASGSESRAGSTLGSSESLDGSCSPQPGQKHS